MRTPRWLLGALLALAFLHTPSALGGYTYSRTVTIDHTKVPNTDQSSFPVLFSGTYSYLADTGHGGHVQNTPNGYDIIFTSDAAGATKLDHEIESYDATTGAVNYWIRVATVSKTTDTVIYLWYGNAAISSSQENKAGVWDSSYKGVWHLNEAASPSVDSTANNNGSWLNTPVVNATAKIAGGLTFTGSSNMEDNVSSTFSLGTTSVTMEAWAYLTGTTLSGAFIKLGGTSPNQGYAIGVGGTTYDSTGNVPIALYEGIRWIPATGKTYGTGWHHVVLVIDASGHPIIYVDGASIYTDTGVAPAAPASSITHIGGYTGSGSEQRHFSGTLDEVRISGAVRSADWINAEYNNQNSPSTFYTVGSEWGVTVNNFSFESPEEGNSGASTTCPTSWTCTPAANGTFNVGAYSPVNPTQYNANGTDGLPSGHTVPPDGSARTNTSNTSGGYQALYVNFNNGGETVSQNTAALIANNTTYTLGVWIGHRLDFAWGNATIQLLANGVVWQSSGLLADPGAGHWAQASLTFTTGASDTHAGQTLGIALVDNSSVGSGQTNFDVVTLTAVPVVGAATKLAFTTQPGNATGGSALSTEPAVTLQDAYGNTVVGTAQNVTLAIQNNAGPGGVLGGTLTVAVNTGTGVATFSGLSIDKAGTGYTLTATGSTVNTTPGVVVSSAFNITVGAAAKLAFTTQPGGGTGGTAWATQPVVTVQDAGGNTVATDSSTVTVAIQNNAGPGGVLSGTLTKAAVSGVASFSANGLKIDKAGTGYTLTVTDGALTSTTSSAFNITAGALDHFAVTTPSGPQTAGTAFGITTITAQDASNNTVTGYTGTVALTETGGGAGGTVSPTQSGAFTAGVLSGQSVTLSKSGTLVTITVTDPGYLYQRAVTIDHTKVPATNQSNFPVLVSGSYSYLATVANGGKVSNSNGFDIIFTADAAGFTKLDHEIESYNATTGAVAFWVRVPTVSKTTDTVIYLLYGNSAISSSQENKAGVWDSSYKGVWHLNEAASPSVDSTANNNGSWLNTPVVNATAKIAGGLTFTGSSNMEDNVSSTFGLGTISVTIEAWVYLTSTTVSGAFIKIGGTSPNQGYAIGVGDTTYDGTGNVPIALYEGVRWIPATGKTYGTGWHHAVLVIDASGHPNIYVDGSSIYSDATGIPAAPASSVTYIGGYTSSLPSNRHFTGTLDEVRISGAVRSADWIKTEYNNQNSPATFYTVGSEVNGAYGGTKTGVSGTFTVNPGTATKLTFGTQPSNTGAGSTITPAVTVRILDSNNNLTSSTASVTVAIGANPGGGALSGTLGKAAVAGTATFNDLSINLAGTGYTLTAASSGLTGATSGTFDITVSGYWVNNATGSDANSGLQSAPFATIGHAVSVMGNSGILFVQVGNSRSSPYAANIVVTTVQAGTAGQRTLIQGVASGATLPLVRGTDPTADVGFDVQASYVTVDGFEIQNTQVGIYSEASNTGAQISNNYVLAGNLGYGIILDTTSNAVVTGNRAAPGSGGASFFGIWDWHGTGNRIDGNSVAGQGEGITSHYSTGLTIQRNVTAGNPMGIHISNATGPVTLYNNTVDQSAWLGIYVEQSQAGVTITSRDNIVTNGGYGWAWDGAGTMPSSNYDDVFGNTLNYRVPVTPGGNSISADPNFVQTTDPTQATYYQLNAGSPCLTSGTDLGLGLGTHIGAK